MNSIGFQKTKQSNANCYSYKYKHIQAILVAFRDEYLSLYSYKCSQKLVGYFTNLGMQTYDEETHTL